MARIGYGISLSCTDGASNAHQAIPDILSITTPEQEQGKVDITTVTQGTNMKNYTPGLVEGGSLQVECQFTHALFERMQALRGQSKDWRMTVGSDTSIWTGFVTKIGGVNVGPEDVVKFKFEVCITTDITLS